MEITIRGAIPDDYSETENITREAFWNQYAPGCSEHYLLHTMRESDDFFSPFDLVAEADEKIVGHAISFRGTILCDDQRQFDVLTLGPISVLPEYQNKGVGAKLIESTKELARLLYFKAILLFGDPLYYTRRGFVPAEHLMIRTGDNMFAAALLACELWPDALVNAQGRYVEHDIYKVDETEAAKFDKTFPYKPKIRGIKAQKRFYELVMQRYKMV